ncbi:MAG: hypothetical protein GXO66_05170 [Euryarchaeota archaeon]|nr:hypothetical protein [Euryarchaeota archaeon]
MRLKNIARLYGSCGGSTCRVKIYFEERGRTFYWDELFPRRIRRSPAGSADREEVRKVVSALRRELSRRRFTSEAYYLRKALRSLGG